MNFSLEIGPHTDLETLPSVKDVYITLLPGEDYKETCQKAGDLVKKDFNPVPHFPARSINDENELKDYVSRCKDAGVKQALVIGGSRDPIGKRDYKLDKSVGTSLSKEAVSKIVDNLSKSKKNGMLNENENSSFMDEKNIINDDI